MYFRFDFPLLSFLLAGYLVKTLADRYPLIPWVSPIIFIIFLFFTETEIFAYDETYLLKQKKWRAFAVGFCTLGFGLAALVIAAAILLYLVNGTWWLEFFTIPLVISTAVGVVCLILLRRDSRREKKAIELEKTSLPKQGHGYDLRPDFSTT